MLKRTLLAPPLLLLSACGAPTEDAENTDNSMTLTETCERPDILDSVSVQTKHDMARYGGYVTGYIQILDNSVITYDKVQGTKKKKKSSGQIFAVTCTAAFKLDHSNSSSGQDVIQFPELRWTILYAGGTNDLSSTNYTIALDRSSMANILINGQHPPQPDAVEGDAVVAPDAFDQNEAEGPGDGPGSQYDQVLDEGPPSSEVTNAM